MDLNGRKILFISPFFFDYEKRICEKMTALGAEVKLYNERSVTGSFNRAMIKVMPGLYNGHSNRYYASIITENSDIEFDYILIVRCDMITVKTIKALRTAYPSAKLCLHLWDSMKNIPHISEKIGLFDIATSFDKDDCSKGYGLTFRPLFYSDNFTEIEDAKKEYDISFCGTVHSDRFRIIKAVEKQCEQSGLRFYKFCYLQGKFIYNYYKMTKREFRGVPKSEFSFDKKPNAEIADIENRSVAVLDIQHPQQSGLTMRTIEMVGLKKKMITTNKKILDYDFYDPQNICVIDRDNPKIDENFLHSPYADIAPEVFDYYSLERWIYDVLGITGEQNDEQ